MNNKSNKEIIEEISFKKNEPLWMLEFRLKALEHYSNTKTPAWGADLSKLNENSIEYYVKPVKDLQYDWADVPEDIKKTFDDLGIPKAEQEILAGVGAQYDSELIYKSLKKEWSDKGVLFMDISQALVDHKELVEKYFATVVPYHDNKFAALNSAFWSGGSFVYIPKNIEITVPLQAYFRINTQAMGQF